LSRRTELGFDPGLEIRHLLGVAKGKQCIHCGKPATIHLTQIVEGEIRKVDLCESCQVNDSMASDFDLEPFAKLAEGVATAVQQQSGKAHVCGQCGCDDEQLHKSGRFGCPDCYEAFEPLLPEMLRRIQSGVVHVGKVPVKGIQRQEIGRREKELRRNLENAIREERFEDAAVFRDQLRQLEGDKIHGIKD